MNTQGWCLLRNSDDWLQYRREYEAAVAGSVRRWAAASQPSQYPLMVCSLLVDGTAYTAAMYRQEAQALMESREPVPSRAVATAVSATQAEFNQHVSAMVLALLNTLIESRQITRERFEAKLTAFKALADQVAAGNRDPAAFKAVDGADIVFPAPPADDAAGPPVQQHEPPPSSATP